jgi:hypothetical protein
VIPAFILTTNEAAFFDPTSPENKLNSTQHGFNAGLHTHAVNYLGNYTRIAEQKLAQAVTLMTWNLAVPGSNSAGELAMLTKYLREDCLLGC